MHLPARVRNHKRTATDPDPPHRTNAVGDRERNGARDRILGDGEHPLESTHRSVGQGGIVRVQEIVRVPRGHGVARLRNNEGQIRACNDVEVNQAPVRARRHEVDAHILRGDGVEKVRHREHHGPRLVVANDAAVAGGSACLTGRTGNCRGQRDEVGIHHDTRVTEPHHGTYKMIHMTETFDHSVYQRRLDMARTAIAERGLHGVIIGTGAELAYLTGSWISTHERFTALIIAADGTATLVAPGVDKGELSRSPVGEMDITIAGWADGENPYAITATALGGDAHGATVGVGSSITADHLFRLREELPGATFVLATTVLKELFMRKDPEEIEWLRTAGKAIDNVFLQVPSLLQAGRTEREVAADIEKLILEGHDVVDFIIVGSGPNGANPHHDFSDRVLEAGDVVVVDLGGTVGPGYHSDCTRTFVVPGAEPSEDYTKFIPVLLRAQEEAVKAVRPGVTAEYVDSVARDIISEAGYGDAYFHRTGHGIGLSMHEDPFIIAGNTMPLEEGMTFSIEPGIYLTGNVGARIEDIVVVTADGCERLNNSPRS